MVHLPHGVRPHRELLLIVLYRCLSLPAMHAMKLKQSNVEMNGLGPGNQ